MTPEGVFSSHGGEMYFMVKARLLVVERVQLRLRESDPTIEFSSDDVTPYWFRKEPKGWQVLFSTNLPDNIYYGVSHDVASKETSVTTYHKFDSETFSDEETY